MTRINLGQARKKVVRALPVRVRWLVEGCPLDFDFSRARCDLRPLADSDTNGFEIPQEWVPLFLFGEQDYAEGGGATPFLGVHADTGQVFGLDAERESEPVYLLNSDIDKFILTFDVFDRALRQGSLPVKQVPCLAEEIDPTAFAVGEWRDLAEAIASGADYGEDPTE